MSARTTETRTGAFLLVLLLAIAFALFAGIASVQASIPHTAGPHSVVREASGVFPDSRWEKLSYRAGKSTVPALVIEPISSGPERPAPCLLLVHALGMQKEMLLPLARLAAQDGYASLIIDLPESGERRPKQPVHIASVDGLVALIDSTLSESIADLSAGIDLLASRPSCDTTRLGVVGISLGSFVATDLAAADSRVKIVLLIASGGGLGEILEFEAKSKTSFGALYAPLILQAGAGELDRRLAAVDPINSVARIAPRPLLMENGAADNIIPPSAASRLYEAAGEPKEIEWFPGEGHIPSPLGLYAGVSVFLAKNLPVKAGGGRSAGLTESGK